MMRSGRDPLFLFEWSFRLIGVALMVMALLGSPVNLYLFFIGALNYLFSLYAMRKRQEMKIIHQAVVEVEKALEE